MTHCAAWYCHNSRKGNSSLSFYRIPRNQERAKLWVEKTWRKDLLKRNWYNFRVCSQHFSDVMFTSKETYQLKKSAYPDVEPSTIITKKTYLESKGRNHISPVHNLGGENMIRHCVTEDSNSPQLDDVEVVIFGNSPNPEKEVEGLKTENFCRVCACETKDSEPIFKNIGSQKKIAKMIHTCLPIKVSPSDKLPLQICSVCLKKLDACHKLLNCCTDANVKLLALFGGKLTSFKEVEECADRALNKCFVEWRMKRNGHNAPTTASSSTSSTSKIETIKEVSMSTEAGASAADKRHVEVQEEVVYPVEVVWQYKRQTKLLPKPKKYKVVLAKVVKKSRCAPCEESWGNLNKSHGHSTDALRLRTQNLNESDQQSLPVLNQSKTLTDKSMPGKEQHFHSVELQFESDNSSSSGHQQMNSCVSAFLCSSCNGVFVDEEQLQGHQSMEHSDSNFQRNSRNSLKKKEVCAKVEHDSKLIKLSDRHLLTGPAGVQVANMAEVVVEVSASNVDDLNALDIQGNVPKAFRDVEASVKSQIIQSIQRIDALSMIPFKAFNSAQGERNVMVNVEKRRQIKGRENMCRKCHKIFTSEKKLGMHIIRHGTPLTHLFALKAKYARLRFRLRSVTFPCGKCNRVLHSKQSVARHVTAHQACRCGACNRQFSSFNSLIVHKKSHTSEKPYLCGLCGKSFRSNHRLNTHMLYHNSGGCKKTFTCEFCSKHFPSLPKRNSHMREHAEKAPFTCQLCSKGLYTKATLKQHIGSHLEPCPFVCDVCGANYKKQACMNIHKRLHKNIPFTCQVCGVTFSDRRRCKCSMENVQCNVCRKIIVSRSMFTHLRVHRRLKSYLCDICRESFAYKVAYRNHYRIHLHEKPFICDICGRRFTSKVGRDYHRKLHTVGAFYLWRTFRKGFGSGAVLRQHNAVHSEEFYSCTLCSNRFRRLAVLKMHIRQCHTAENLSL